MKKAFPISKSPATHSTPPPRHLPPSFILPRLNCTPLTFFYTHTHMHVCVCIHYPLNSNITYKKKTSYSPKSKLQKMSTKTNWYPTPPPPLSPKILNLPTRKSHRKKPKSAAAATKPPRTRYKGKLETLFDEEREFSRTFPAIVLLNSNERRSSWDGEGGDNGVFAAEKWRFQVEILRAECKFLRMEREFALKKLERNRLQMERTLRSAVHTLVSGRKKINEGKNVGVVLQEEIEDLAEKLVVIQKSYGVRDIEVQNCSNFDKKACILHRRLKKLGGLSEVKCTKQIPEMPESNLSINTSHEHDKEGFVLDHKSSQKSTDVEVLRMKMEGLSKGMLDRMEEEYGSMFSTTGNSSVASSASNSKRMEHSDSSSISTRQPYQETVSHEEYKCSGRCKAVVRRIVEQVRTETEQWSQMQDMLGKVREEMEELQTSRDFWEGRALGSDNEIMSLQSSVQEWREKAVKSETKVNELQAEVCAIRDELEKLKVDPKRVSVTPEDLASSPLFKQLEKEKHILVCHEKETHSSTSTKQDRPVVEKLRFEHDKEVITHKDLPPLSLGRQLEKEKRMYFCRVKENHRIVNEKGSKQEDCSDGIRKSHKCSSRFVAHSRRSALRDIGNSSSLSLMKQNSNAIYPVHCQEPLKTEENF